MLKHPVSGEIKEMGWGEFAALFPHSYPQRIKEAVARNAGTEAVVCYEVLDMGSSHVGERAALCVGGTCTYSFEQGIAKHLGMYPVGSSTP